MFKNIDFTSVYNKKDISGGKNHAKTRHVNAFLKKCDSGLNPQEPLFSGLMQCTCLVTSGSTQKDLSQKSKVSLVFVLNSLGF